LVLDYRGGDATLVSAGSAVANDLYHGEAWSIDLKNLDDATLADLTLQVSAWDNAISGVTPPTGSTPGLAGSTWSPVRETTWNTTPTTSTSAPTGKKGGGK
jgi:hypothetical protein